jgi:hypothetical protein
MHGHVLRRELKLDGQTAKLHDLAHSEPDRDGPDVPGCPIPVRQDIAGVSQVPAITEKD